MVTMKQSMTVTTGGGQKVGEEELCIVMKIIDLMKVVTALDIETKITDLVEAVQALVIESMTTDLLKAVQALDIETS